MTATKRLQDATDAFQEACKRGEQSTIDSATAELVLAQKEIQAATEDAMAREKVAQGGRRRDRVVTVEQEAQRNALFASLGIDPKDAQTASVKGQKLGIDIDQTYRKILDLWTVACNAMGNSTVGRWLLISAIHRAGPPPGWDEEWPPKVGADGE